MNDTCDSRRSGDGTEQEGEPPSPAPSSSVLPASVMIELDVIHEGGDWSAISDIEAVIQRAAEAAARIPQSGLAGTSAALALSSDEHVATLNAAYRGKDSPTNVLSFPASPDLPLEPGEPMFLGDIIFAAETVVAEAADLHIMTSHHLQHLVVHGLLHLAGFDHETEDEAVQMESLETRVLATLGIADPYANSEN